MPLEKRIELAKKAGVIFTEKFKDSSKYNSFIINFCQFHETIDLYKIPYNFINEFIYYSLFNFSNNLNEILTFKLIDQFYGKLKLLDFEEIINKKQNEKHIHLTKPNEKDKDKKNVKKKKKNNLQDEKERIKQIEKEIQFIDLKKENEDFEYIYLFSFDNFSKYYQNNLRAIINREQEDDKENFSKIKSINKQYKKYKRNNYFLSKKILNIYITFTNNNLEELLKTFKLIKKQKKSDQDILINREKSSLININNSITNNINNINSEADSKNNNSLDKSNLINNEEEEIDYLELIKNKKFNDEISKEDFFGTFDIIEIANIIEDNFILERYFSSYTLIKYSLLNVLAVTREIESEIINNQDIIQIICDFCALTKLVIKKYMKIYLKIFKEIYNKYKESRVRSQIKGCINMISLYFKKNNLILSKENEDFLKKINEQNDSSEIFQNDYNFKEYVKKYGKFFIISEKIFSSNKRYKFENSLKTIETIYLGKYEDKKNEDKENEDKENEDKENEDKENEYKENEDKKEDKKKEDKKKEDKKKEDKKKKDKKKEDKKKKDKKKEDKKKEDKKKEDKKKEDKIFDFKYEEINDLNIKNEGNKKPRFIPKTPILLYDNTNKILKQYLSNFKKDNIPYKDLYDDILSLLFYFKIPIIKVKWIDNREKKKEIINNKGSKSKSDKKKQKEEEKEKSKASNKEKKLKSDHKKKNDKENKQKSITSEKNNEKSIFNESNFFSINDESFKSGQSEVFYSNINGEDINKKESLAITEEKLDEILKEIIALLCDLLNNIKKKYICENIKA